MSIRIEFEVEVSIDQIMKDWDVRLISGDKDLLRVELLSGLYKDGKVKNLIEVAPPINGVYRLVEGRTRYAALLANKVKKVTVGVLSVATDDEYITYAYCCNSQGTKPPELEDLKMTIEQLMQRGLTEKQIKSGPLSLVESSNRLKIACDQVRSLLTKRNTKLAVTMTNNSTLSDPEERLRAASKKYGVTVKAIRKARGDSGPTTKRNTLLNEIKKDLGGVQNTHRTRLKTKIRWIEGRHFEGINSTDQIFEVYDYMLGQHRANVKLIEDAREQLELRVNGVSGVVPVKETVRKKRASASA